MLFDAHGDILTDMYEQSKKGNYDSFKQRHLDAYKKGGITHSIFVNWTNPKTKNNNEFNEIFDSSFDEISRNLDIFKLCLNSTDLITSITENKIGVILGIEGLGQLESVDQIEYLYNQGLRHASLTWNDINKYATGLDDNNTKGISKEGAKLLKKMEKLGMIIDLAHLNQKSFDEVFDIVKGPVIISHGNTKKICSHKRNYTDEQLLKVKERNGVLGICGIAPFISSNVETQTVDEMVNHIDHAVSIMGIDHVGLGLDVCYYLYDNVPDNKVEGFKHISDAGNIIIELKQRNYSDEDIEKIKYKNFFRVIKEVLG